MGIFLQLVILFIYNGIEQLSPFPSHYVYVIADKNGLFAINTSTKSSSTRFATAEEKQVLFDIIKANGYRWNFQAHKLEKLIIPNFKKGDKVRVKDGVDYRTINDVCDTFYTLVPTGKLEFIDQNNWELVPDIKPIFKVGDRVKNKTDIWSANRTIKSYVKDIGYFTTINDWIRIEDQDNWELVAESTFKKGDRVKHKESGIYCTIGDYAEGLKGYHTSIGLCIADKDVDSWELAPNKFDINTLKPFKSNVLVRDADHYEWEGAVFGRYDGKAFFAIGGINWKYCIPYEGNEHLFGTTNDCADFYKIWNDEG